MRIGIVLPLINSCFDVEVATNADKFLEGGLDSIVVTFNVTRLNGMMVITSEMDGYLK